MSNNFIFTTNKQSCNIFIPAHCGIKNDTVLYKCFEDTKWICGTTAVPTWVIAWTKHTVKYDLKQSLPGVRVETRELVQDVNLHWSDLTKLISSVNKLL